MTELADRETIDRLASENVRLYKEVVELRQLVHDLKELLDEAYRSCATEAQQIELFDSASFHIDL